MKLVIDSTVCEAAEGQTILEAARHNGIFIPSLCYHPKTGPAAKCRVCVVTVEGMRGMQTACNVPVKDGMVVTTNSVELRTAQRMIVDLLLSSGRHDCLACERSGTCELQDVAYFLGIERPSFAIPESFDKDESSEFIVKDDSRCIYCGRCIAGCNGTVVNEVLGFGYRGRKTQVVCDDDIPMEKSTCVQCGECVQLCPTGALVNKKSRGQGRPWMLETVDSTCPFCGVGCQVTLHIDRAKNKITRVSGREIPPNDGMLCVKGRYAYDFPSSKNRLTHPQIRKNGTLETVSWDEALNYTAGRIKDIVARDGPDVFSAFGSGRITNENNYAIQKFTRAVIGTNNVDHCART